LLVAAAAGAHAGESPRAARPNLLENGDFEKGKGPGPDGWERPDELTTTWVDAPGRKGRCIRIDTDVLASQYRERRDAIEKALAEGKDPPPPPQRLPTRAPKYDTVAGLDGVSFASREIPIRAGGFYRLSADALVEGAASPRVWVKALAEVKSTSGVRERVVWKKALVCEGAGREWKTFSMTFPSRGGFPEGVRKLRVELYAYWPPAVYHFDDVRLEEVPRTEAARPLRGVPSSQGALVPRAAAALVAWAAETRAHAGAPAEEPAPQWYEGFELRRKILFGRSPSAGDAVLLRAGTSRVTRTDARDVRVVTDHRQPLPLEILEVGPGDTVLLRFEVPSATGQYHLYLGNPNAPRPRRPARPPPGGLLLEVRELGEGDCGSWPEMRRLLEASRNLVGCLAPRRIFLGIPPLGKTGGFVARYAGFLRVAEAGTYTFETASEGGSFVLVGGKLVASWPGFHGLAGYADPRARDKHSGSTRLASGVYPIEYVVASKSGCIHVLAWRKEEEGPKESAARSGPEREAAGLGTAGRGTAGREAAERERRKLRATRPVPEGAFVPWLPASLGPVEARKGPFADFDWEIASDSGSDAERHDLAEIAFRFSGDLEGRGARRARWEFGDGQAAEGSEVRHVYLSHGAYEVSVEVEVAEGARLRATRTVVARFESLERADLDGLLERYHEATRGYDLERLPPEHLARLVWLRSKDAAWKEDLARALDAWYRRGLALGGPETERVERLGLERARELLRRARSEAPAEKGELEALARKILEVLGATAASEERREEARVRLAALDLGGGPARAEAAERA
ncbi:MAG: PKD domain-containing protein, partial [Planctomycetota bacterium]